MKQGWLSLLLILLLLGACSKYDKKKYVTRHFTERETTNGYPYISGDVFRSFSNHIVDNTGIAFYPERVKEGDIVFLKTQYLKKFVKYMHPYIKHPYILITGNGDEEVPGEYAYLLEDDKLMMWFGMNATFPHPKLMPIPIGGGNPGSVTWIDEVFAELQSHPLPKEHLLYLNFSTHTHPERPAVKEYFSQQPFCTVVTPRPGDTLEYMQDLMRSKFTVSPRGNGIDCHRVWESLLLGTIPILKHSPLDPLYVDLPILFVHDWTEITEEFLEKKYVEMSSKQYNWDKIYADYWLKLIDSYTVGKYSQQDLQHTSRVKSSPPMMNEVCNLFWRDLPPGRA